MNVLTFHKLSLNILKYNNYEVNIAPDDLLDTIIDNFFNIYIKENKKISKALTKVLGKKYQTKDLNKLKITIKTFINLFKSNNYKIEDFEKILKLMKRTINIFEYFKNKNTLLLIINIYILYEKELKEESALDFNDMINKSIKCIKETKNIPKWDYIIIDEYQDTSITKYNLIKEIININDSSILAVGDDFQSIYRFTGCNLSVFLNFTKLFEYAKIFQIINTYRNPQELINIAGNFIMKNKYQQKKELISSKHSNEPIVIIDTLNPKITFLNLLRKLSEYNNKIFVLGRNNKDINKFINEDFEIKDKNYKYSNTSFEYLTIHKSKGLEKEIVILINVNDSDSSLPSKIKNEKILKYVNNTKDLYPYEEERRLFYVALTRAKEKVYIINEKNRESIFIKEIRKYKNVTTKKE